jgi:hypothetical protein
MIRGMHGMFYSSQAEALRAFLRDKLGLHGTDVGGGLVTHFKVPGGFSVQLYEPKYAK